MNIDDVLARIERLGDKERKEIEKAAYEATFNMQWVPNPGPQTEAYFSQADELFYGGAAGGGKSSLLCGLAVSSHTKSIIFRREYPQLKGLVDEVARIIGTRDGYNGQDKLWRLPGRELEFGAVQHEDDKEKYQGRAHDLKAFDEITHFTESQYRFLIGWTRTAIPGQRARVVAAGNPPFTAEGAWVIQYWAPWLDETHLNPAKPGELRWFTTINGKDVEVDGPGPFTIDGRQVKARSRTFIPSRLEDNPDLMKTGYASVIEGMPEPLRTMMREGKFSGLQRDEDFQVIPVQWVIEAQARWKPQTDIAMTAMGLDIGEGRDETTLAARHGGWYAEIASMSGPEAKDPAHAASLVVKHRRNRAPVVVDVGGGFGGSSLLLFRENGIDCRPFNGANTSNTKTKDGQLQFANKRAEAWWRFREELDPSQDGGSCIALPPDPKLRSDLTAPKWKLTTRGILLESKEDIRARLGRSPDRGDAVVMALAEGNAAVRKQMASRPMQTTANLGRPAMRRR